MIGKTHSGLLCWVSVSCIDQQAHHELKVRTGVISTGFACKAQPLSDWEDTYWIAVPGQRFTHSPSVSARAKGESEVISTGLHTKQHNPWAARYTIWLLFELTPKVGVFCSLFYIVTHQDRLFSHAIGMKQWCLPDCGFAC